DARFAVAVAGFAELLRGGRHNGKLTFDDVIRMAGGARGRDEFGYRSEFLQLVRAAKTARSMAALEQ
ncbi:YfbK domain-containing protein, partial [Sphingomonas koreensis]